MDLIKRYDPEIFEGLDPKYVVRDPFVFKMAWFVMFFLGFSFLTLGVLKINLPFSLVLGTAAVLLFASTLRNRVVDIKEIYKLTPWSIVFFSVGMYTVVYSLKNVGIIDFITSFIYQLLKFGMFLDLSPLCFGFIP